MEIFFLFSRPHARWQLVAFREQWQWIWNGHWTQPLIFFMCFVHASDLRGVKVDEEQVLKAPYTRKRNVSHAIFEHILSEISKQ
jgi:hypothetical protein